MAEELNFEQELTNFVTREPFEAFVIIVASGDRFRISEDLQVAVGTNTVQLFFPRRGLTILRKNQLVALKLDTEEAS